MERSENDFEAGREGNEQSMKTIIRNLLLAMVWAVAGCLVHGGVTLAAGEPRTEVKAETLQKLLATYKAYGLPLPPIDAPLVSVPSAHTGIHDSTPRVHLGFLLRPGTKAAPPLLLFGTVKCELEPVGEFPDYPILKVTPISPNCFDVETFRSGWWDTAFPQNVGIATALQCKERGYDKLAVELFKASLRDDEAEDRYAYCQLANVYPKTALDFVAWMHWRNELCRSGTDRKTIAKRMRALLYSERKLNTVKNRALLTALDATLRPSRAKPGSIERLIDNLTEASNDDKEPEKPGDKPGTPGFELERVGYDALPNCINHLDDPRLTRRWTWGCNLTVGCVVQLLLHDLAGEAWDYDWSHNTAWNKAKARAWWKVFQKSRQSAHGVSKEP